MVHSIPAIIDEICRAFVIEKRHVGVVVRTTQLQAGRRGAVPNIYKPKPPTVIAGSKGGIELLDCSFSIREIPYGKVYRLGRKGISTSREYRDIPIHLNVDV